MKKNKCILFFLLPLVFFFYAMTAGDRQLLAGVHADSLRVHFIAVGYGDAILIQLPQDHNILLDAGPQESGNVLAQYLKKAGVKNLDKVIISHPHRNHFGGMKKIIDQWSPEHLLTNGQSDGEEGYAQFLKECEKKGIVVSHLRRPAKLLTGTSTHITVLNPDAPGGSVHDNCLVLWLKFHETSFLLTADIEPDHLDRLLELHPFIKKNAVIQIPHHGFSLSEKLLTLPPETIFVISTGNNPWGLPDENTLKRLPGKLYRTDRDGHIVLESDGRNVRKINLPSP